MVNSEPTSEDLFREETARAYLLGELPEGEARAFEERALADAGLRDEVDAAEKDLIDEYVRGELSPPERGRFERLFLASERRRQSVAFAQAFNETRPVASPDPARDAKREGTSTSRIRLLLLSLLGARPALKFAAAALALAVIAAASWLALRPKRPADEMARIEAGRQASREPVAAEPQAGPSPKGGEAGGQRQTPHPPPEGPARDTQRPAPDPPKETAAPPPKPRPARTTVATFLLLGGTSRGEQAAQGINIGEGVEVVRLRLYLEGPAPAARLSARVGLRDGTEVLRREGLRPRPTRGGTFVTLDLPSRSLGAGRDYEVTLSDAASPGTPLEFYRFRVSAR